MRYRCVLILASVLLATVPAAFAATVTVAPSTAVVPVSSSRAFTATVTGAATTAVTWSVNGVVGGSSTLGTISSTGNYQAPSTPPPGYSVQIQATSTADPAAVGTASADISLTHPSISWVSPSSAPANPFTITVYGSNFANGAVIHWNNAPVPTTFVSSTQLQGQIASSQNSNSLKVVNPGPYSQSSGFTVGSQNTNPNISVTVYPSTATVQPGQTRQFTVYVANASSQSVTWSTNIGSITASGLYTAPTTMASSPTAIVTATSVAAPSKSGTATVTLPTPPVTISVSPSTSTVAAGQGVQLSATVSNTTNTAVTWSATVGTVDANGYYSSPASPPPSGYAQVTATSVADATKKATANIRIPDPQAVQLGRFLDQATFGSSAASMADLRQKGVETWLNEQFALGESPLPPVSSNRSAVIDAFFNNQFKGNDQLRQRVIYALSEVVVISMNKNTNGDMIVPYLQILSRNAFGNYRTLLGEITTDASMGFFLDMVNSTKPTAMGGANENYPRELLQLFSIGLYQLDEKGRVKMDPATSKPIPAYTQTDVQQLALALTGWTYNNSTNAPVAPGMRGAYYPGPMVPAPTYHATSSKTILGTTIPANLSPQQDVDAALDIIFNHPNVGPFIATRLIRALVTSNPSDAYIERIAAVFDDDGTGERGDLQAVVRAILTDSEARNDNPPATFGRLRTPVQQLIAMARALNLPLSQPSQFNYLLAGMGEDQLNAPSVFGHYSPTFRIPKTNLFGPEFQIYTATEAINRANFAYSQWFGSGGTMHPALQPYAAIAGDPAALTTAVDVSLLHGRMSQNTRTAIQQAIPQMTDTMQRVHAALYLTVTSGEFLVQR